MAEVDDIVQNIVLTGNEDVNHAFDSMREAGQKAFDAIEKAADHSITSFTGIATAVAGVTAAIGVMAVGMFEFVKSSAESTSTLEDLAKVTGMTVQQITELSGAFSQAGSGTETMGSAFRRLSSTIQNTWNEIKQASAEGVDKLKGDAISVADAYDKMQQAGRDAANAARDQRLQRASDIQSVQGAQQRLDELFSQSAKARGFDTSQFDAVLAQQKEQLEYDQASLALAQAKKKAADDAANADEQAAAKQRAAETATLTYNAAVRKDAEDRKNDLSTITKGVQQVASGDKSGLDTFNASAENIVKGIIASTAGAKDAFKGLQGDITDLAKPAPAVADVFEQITKVLGNLDDAAQRSAVATRLFGRSLSPEELNLLSSAEKLKEFQDRVSSLGIDFEGNAKKLGDFREALNAFKTDVGLIGTDIAAAFGPAFTSILNSLDQALRNNVQSLHQFAETLGGEIQQTVESFIRVLSGVPDAAKDQWLIDYLEKIKAFGEGLYNIGELAVTVFGKIIEAAGKLADALNGIFGTNLNAADILFGAWLASALLNFGKIGTAAKGMGTAVAAGAAVGEAGLAAMLAPILGIVAGLYALEKAWEAAKDFFGIGKTSQADEMLDGAAKRLQAIKDLMTSGDFKKFNDDMAKIDEEQKAASKAKEDVDKQVADGQKARQQDLLAAEKQTNQDSVSDHKASGDQKVADNKKAVDQMIEDNKRLAKDGKDQADTAKAQSDDTKKAATEAKQEAKAASDAQSTTAPPTPPGKLPAGMTTSSQDVKDFFAGRTDLTAPSQAALDKALKPLTDAMAKGPILDPDVVQDALDKFKQFGSDLGKVDSAAADTLKGLSDRSDGSIKNQAPQTQGQLDRMLQNQKQISDYEATQQKEFSKSIVDQVGKSQPVPLKGSGYDPATVGHYDANGTFIPSKQQPPPPASQGAPQPMSFPDYQKQLSDSFGPVPLPQARPADADLGKEIAKGIIDQTKTSVDPSKKFTGLSDTGIPPGGIEDQPGFKPPMPELPPQEPLAPELTQNSTAAADAFASAIDKAVDDVQKFAQALPTDELSQGDMQGIQDKFSSLLDSVGQGIQGALAGGAQPGLQGQDQAMPAVQDLDSSFTTLDSSSTETASSLEDLDSAVSTVAESLAELQSATAAAASNVAGGAAGFAGGGPIRGSGGPTSDSNLIWASDGEFMHSARAVSYWGTAFMNDINNMRMPRFSAGGMIGLFSPAMPRYADGGPISASGVTMAHLGTVDLRTDHGSVTVMASNSAVDQLSRLAVQKRMTSTGRKPGFIT